MDELRLLDYLTRPLQELKQHPSYSEQALLKADWLLDLKTTQLENLDISGVIK